jgi:hypothetical protein
MEDTIICCPTLWLDSYPIVARPISVSPGFASVGDFRPEVFIRRLSYQPNHDVAGAGRGLGWHPSRLRRGRLPRSHSQKNVLGKTTDSTRQKSLRHLRELYALDEGTPIFGLLRRLYSIDAASLPLAVGAWRTDQPTAG